jgi:hypothetical protein
MAAPSLSLSDYVPQQVWSGLAHPLSVDATQRLVAHESAYRTTIDELVRTCEDLTASIRRMAAVAEMAAGDSSIFELQGLEATIDDLEKHRRKADQLAERAWGDVQAFTRMNGGITAAAQAHRQRNAYLKLSQTIAETRARLLAVRDALLLNDLKTIDTGLPLDEW